MGARFEFQLEVGFLRGPTRVREALDTIGATYTEDRRGLFGSRFVGSVTHDQMRRLREFFPTLKFELEP